MLFYCLHSSSCSSSGLCRESGCELPRKIRVDGSGPQPLPSRELLSEFQGSGAVFWIIAEPDNEAQMQRLLGPGEGGLRVVRASWARVCPPMWNAGRHHQRAGFCSTEPTQNTASIISNYASQVHREDIQSAAMTQLQPLGKMVAGNSRRGRAPCIPRFRKITARQPGVVQIPDLKSRNYFLFFRVWW